MKRLVVLLLSSILAGCNYVPLEEKQPVAKQGEGKQADKKIPWGKVNRYGLFSERKRGYVQKDPKAGTGKVIRGAMLEFAEEKTDRVPLRKGVYFGYRYWLRLPPDQAWADLKRVLIHPEITLPDGTKVTRSERTIRKRTTHGIVTALDAYALSEDYELVPGDWIFQIWYENKMLLEQRFVTYWPGEDKK